MPGDGAPNRQDPGETVVAGPRGGAAGVGQEHGFLPAGWMGLCARWPRSAIDLQQARVWAGAGATAAPSRAVDYLVLALAEGPLERDALIEAAKALGSKNKHLGVYLGQQKRETDGFITQYLGRYELTRKGRQQLKALGGPVVVVQEG